jgi:hypothetical protein
MRARPRLASRREAFDDASRLRVPEKTRQIPLAPSSTMEEQSEERSGDHVAAVDEDPSTAPVPEHVRLRATRARRDGEESPRAI